MNWVLGEAIPRGGVISACSPVPRCQP